MPGAFNCYAILYGRTVLGPAKRAGQCHLLRWSSPLRPTTCEPQFEYWALLGSWTHASFDASGEACAA